MKPNKKFLSCLLGYFILALSYNIVIANETNSQNEAARVDNYISVLYAQLDFTNSELLSFTVFDKAMRGYLNLKNAGKLRKDKEILSVCDFNQPSTLNRLWVIDLEEKKILFNTYVAHGQATGEDCAMAFSNKMNSHQSSIGFYVTTDTYIGEHGFSLHVNGLDQGFNDAALKRDIVVHGADYVSEKFICENNRLGRSWGCPAVPEHLATPIINTIKEGTCMFIYYPEPKYLASGFWLNKKVASLPDYQMYGDMMPPTINKPRVRVIQYIHNGKLDSVKNILLD